MARRRSMAPEEIPELPGYITTATLAERYNVDKGTIYYMLYNQGKFTRAYKVMKGTQDEKPLLLFDEKEAISVMEARQNEIEEKARPSATAQAIREFNRRVKDWGTSMAWTQTAIRVSGSPTKALVEAYLDAHPDEVRPG